jgi:hypothetical protein
MVQSDAPNLTSAMQNKLESTRDKTILLDDFPELVRHCSDLWFEPSSTGH